MTDDPTPTGPAPHRLATPDGETIAYHQSPGEGTGLIWLGGFKSDMEGSKVLTLERWARAAGRPFTRFDYFGHGVSSGAFRDGTISRWRDDALRILDEVAEGPQILIGSSMGGWIASLVALARPARVKGIVFVAPAPDFTEQLMWAGFSDDVKAEIMDKGEWLSPSEYGFDPYPITRALIEDGRANCIMTGSIAIDCPVRILQGMRDPDVPWTHALSFAEQLTSEDVTCTLIKDGDHRLSDEQNLARLVDTVETLCWEVEGAAD
jgi:pimeloyl-ACP methyl ester carboxylesterase